MFKVKPEVFRNTELIYNNKIAEFARQLGFKGILAEGWDKYLHWRSPNYLYTAPPEKLGYTHKELLLKYRFNNRISPKIGLLLKNYKLSDDIAFRFGNRGWAPEHRRNSALHFCWNCLLPAYIVDLLYPPAR